MHAHVCVYVCVCVCVCVFVCVRGGWGRGGGARKCPCVTTCNGNFGSFSPFETGMILQSSTLLTYS